MSRCKSVTALYAVCHFAVDLGCAYAVFSACSAGKMGFLLYNFCAFALQMPLGLLADAWGHNHRFAVLGILLTATMCLFPGFGLGGAVILGLGNALFHIGGGLDVLNLSGAQAAPLGVFVSPGALGLYIGTRWGKYGLPGVTRILAVVLLLGLAVLTACLLEGKPLPANAPLAFPKRPVYPWAALLTLVVVLRSWGGMAAAFPWKTGHWILLSVLVVVLGKTAGGFASDRFGSRKASTLSLLTAALLFFLGNGPICGVLALFLFNMTMPITLWALAQAMPGCRGFSFGLLTFALFLGFLPVYLGGPSLAPWAMGFLSLASCALLLPGLKRTVGDD